jgi:hypothetical protein
VAEQPRISVIFVLHTVQKTKAYRCCNWLSKSSGGLRLLVDSTGLKFLGEGEWKRKKHGPEYRRKWRKLHNSIDAKTLQIRAVQLTANNVSDSQVLEDLLAQIPLDEQIDSVYTEMVLMTKTMPSGHCRSASVCSDST